MPLLCSFVDDLQVSGGRPAAAAASAGKGHQWTPPKPQVKTGGANFQMGAAVGPTLPPAGVAQQPALRPGYTQPQMFGMQPAAFGQQPVMQPSTNSNMFTQQRVPVNDPFGAPVPGNQALF